MYKMLPSAKDSLYEGGLSEKAASWLLIVLFLSGVVGIQVLSNAMHHYLPSHVVDCDHTHGDEEDGGSEMESCDEDEENHTHSNGKLHQHDEMSATPTPGIGFQGRGRISNLRTVSDVLRPVRSRTSSR